MFALTLCPHRPSPLSLLTAAVVSCRPLTPAHGEVARRIVVPIIPLFARKRKFFHWGKQKVDKQKENSYSGGDRTLSLPFRAFRVFCDTGVSGWVKLQKGASEMVEPNNNFAVSSGYKERQGGEKHTIHPAKGARPNSVRNRRRGNRPVRRSRRLAVPALTLTLAVLATFVGSAVARRNGPAPIVVTPITSLTVPMTVEPGDTLWSLARKYGDPTKPIVERVDALAVTNDLTSNARLYPGNRLLVQVENPTELAHLQAQQAKVQVASLAK
jgi:hypothetical protein